jgi:hypothetical protein
MDDAIIDPDRDRIVYPATLVFDGDEMEVSATKEGVPYLLFRGVRVETAFETVERTVMAFGDAMKAAEPLRTPGRPVLLRVYDSGRVMKVYGEEARAA